MVLEGHFLDILVCPQCRGGITLVDSGSSLLCERCKLKYPVRDGIPVLLAEEAVDLRVGVHPAGGSHVKLPRVSFRVIEGPDTNMTFQLEVGTCRAIGRASADQNKTTVFNVDLTLVLDEGTRSLIMQYITRQFKKSSGDKAQTGERLFGFRRAPDVVLTDTGLSRLHAMIFSDETGVGILDLVSKNGTFVNGKEVESKLLKRGDTVEIGDTTISFEG